MNETMQTILALTLAAAALGYLLWRGLRRRGGRACSDSGCDCGKAALKPKQK